MSPCEYCGGFDVEHDRARCLSCGAPRLRAPYVFGWNDPRKSDIYASLALFGYALVRYELATSARYD
jgi:hypothetical protein